MEKLRLALTASLRLHRTLLVTMPVAVLLLPEMTPVPALPRLLLREQSFALLSLTQRTLRACPCKQQLWLGSSRRQRPHQRLQEIWQRQRG